MQRDGPNTQRRDAHGFGKLITGKATGPLRQQTTANERIDGVDSAMPASALLPAEPGVWVFVLCDLTAFCIFFAGFLYSRLVAPALFEQAQHSLSRSIGVTNTLLLITSSLFVAIGVEQLRKEHRVRARWFFICALSLGFAFVALKVAEYTLKVSAGIGPNTNEFFAYYFILTGLHLSHVLLGLPVLGYLSWASTRIQRSTRQQTYVDAGACYWHMVDAIWIILFPLLYLVR